MMFGGAGIPGAVAAGNQPGGIAANGNIQGVSNNPLAGNQAFGNQGFSNQAFGNQGFNQAASSQPGGVNQPGQTNQSNPDDTSNPMQPVSQMTDSANPNAQVFGGAPIIGVASTSKKKSIREFNKKNHYKDWMFIYDPSSDRGGLLNTPAQPNLLGNNPAQGVPAATGQGQGAPGVPLPNNGSFGQQGMPMPNQPPDQMQQPQQ
jgi:hypothetical protein